MLNKVENIETKGKYAHYDQYPKLEACFQMSTAAEAALFSVFRKGVFKHLIGNLSEPMYFNLFRNLTNLKSSRQSHGKSLQIKVRLLNKVEHIVTKEIAKNWQFAFPPTMFVNSIQNFYFKLFRCFHNYAYTISKSCC